MREYARIRGVNLNAVQTAIKSGRIHKTRDDKIDVDEANREWFMNTDPAQQRKPDPLFEAQGGVRMSNMGTFQQAKTADIYYRAMLAISLELFSDSIIFSLFYKNNQFTNKDDKNYIMPFSAEELDCDKNDLNVLFPNEFGNDLFSNDLHDKPFDFREWLKQFEFSEEAKNLYNAALEIFKFYHRNKEYSNKDWNDSFYDVTNAIMGKDTSTFSELETENDTRITKTKTTKGTRGFGRNTIKYVINSEYLPIFEKFFDARDILAKKINKQLVDSGLLLWERENIY